MINASPIAVPMSALTAAYCSILIQQHIAAASAPISVTSQIFISQDDIQRPNANRMESNGVYITPASDGCTINANKSNRRLQRFVVVSWAIQSKFAALGGQVVSQALRKTGRNITESAIIFDTDSGLYYVEVKGYFSTLISGREMLY
jgi:hypothetical protein